MLIAAHHLVDRLRHPRSRADEVFAVRRRLVAQRSPSAASDEELALELATEVADTEVGAIRDLERASLRAAKRAACMFRAWRVKAPRRGSRETQRGELVVREDSVGMTAAALTTVPATVR